MSAHRLPPGMIPSLMSMATELACGLVAILICLKLLGPFEEWSWWAVTAPVWGLAVAVLGLMLLSLLFEGVCGVLNDEQSDSNDKEKDL